MRLRRRTSATAMRVHDGVVLDGHVWVGDGTEIANGRVVIDPGGLVAAIGATTDIDAPAFALHVSASWVGPGLYDAHVHLAFGRPDDIVAGGVVAVRDLGAPPVDAAKWRGLGGARGGVAGPPPAGPGGDPPPAGGGRGGAAVLSANP